jgi:hypothetical protein
MALSDRAAALAPFLQQLLYDKEVQGAMSRAVAATRAAYGRARGRSARQAVEDKKLRRQLQQALGALGELWLAIGEPTPRRKSRWRLKLTTLAVGGAGAFLATNAGAREKVLNLVARKDAKPANSPS